MNKLLLIAATLVVVEAVVFLLGSPAASPTVTELPPDEALTQLDAQDTELNSLDTELEQLDAETAGL